MFYYLEGHIHFNDKEYDIAKGNYQQVLNLTDHEDLINLAREGLRKIESGHQEANFENNDDDSDDDDIFSFDDEFSALDIEESDFSDEIEEVDDEEPADGWTESIEFDNIEWDDADLEEDLDDLNRSNLTTKSFFS